MRIRTLAGGSGGAAAAVAAVSQQGLELRKKTGPAKLFYNSRWNQNAKSRRMNLVRFGSSFIGSTSTREHSGTTTNTRVRPRALEHKHEHESTSTRARARGHEHEADRQSARAVSRILNDMRKRSDVFFNLYLVCGLAWTSMALRARNASAW